MKKLLVSFFLPILLFACYSCDSDSDQAEIRSLLRELDDCIANRQQYFDRKEAEIDSIHHQYERTTSDTDQFELLGRLFDEYRSYNSDLALASCQRKLALSKHMSDPTYLLHARLNLAEQLVNISMYKEALEIVEPLNSTDVPDFLQAYLFHIKRKVYGLLSDYSDIDDISEQYRKTTDIYRDSLLLTNDPNGLIWHIIYADKLNNKGMPQEAIDDLNVFLASDANKGEREPAIATYTMSDSYRLLGDKVNEQKMLIKASIDDMKAPAREYLSLRRLALLLYEQGDVDRAYKYLKVCMEDAQECNARQQILEINNIFPIVNDVYLNTIASQKREQTIILVIVGVLLVVLMITLYYLRKQIKRVSAAQASEREMNQRLTELNEELKGYNKQLLIANQSIAENSHLKEEYIARYMDQCLGYIDKLDSYRKNLHKLAMAQRIDELKQQTKSVTFIDAELKSFYDNFDETFLRLFPTFVEDFNKLLRPDEQLQPKQDGHLNTELRIFALIRLGITDSIKISKFLRYSVATIYNYRTRVRNRALGDRDLLEEQLMQIGRSNRRNS